MQARGAFLYCRVVPPADAAIGRADVHLHTRASDGLMSAQTLVDYAEHQTDLDVIAITLYVVARNKRRSSRRGGWEAHL